MTAEVVCGICGRPFKTRRQLGGHRAGKHFKGLGLKNANLSTDNLTDAQVGYLAAFLDGEGGIQITRTRRPDREYTLALHPTVYFTNTNKMAIDTMRGWIGSGCITRRKEREGCKDSFVLQVTGTRNIERLLACLRPHMIVKAKQTETMLAYCRSRLSHLRWGDRRFSEDELTLYTALRGLNTRGGKTQRQRTDR
jgi:hypothetical protein